MVTRLVAMMVALALSQEGCGGKGATPGAPASAAAAPAGACRLPDGPLRPIVLEVPRQHPPVDWLVDRGLIAMHIVGCEIEVLRACRIPGKYSWKRIDGRRAHAAARDPGELRGTLPLAAAKLEAALAKVESLEVTMVQQGSYVASRAKVSPKEFQGDCGRATHLVTRLAVGTFAVRARGAVVAQGGDARTCNAAPLEAGKKPPPHGCASALWAEVTPVESPVFGSDVRMTAPTDD